MSNLKTKAGHNGKLFSIMKFTKNLESLLKLIALIMPMLIIPKKKKKKPLT